MTETPASVAENIDKIVRAEEEAIGRRSRGEAVTAAIGFRESAVDAAFTLRHYRELYTDSLAYTALLNTLGFAAITLAVALFFGIPIAWLAPALCAELPERAAALSRSSGEARATSSGRPCRTSC